MVTFWLVEFGFTLVCYGLFLLLRIKHYTCIYMYTGKKSKMCIVHVLMRDERRKEERSKQGQTNNKAKQHSIVHVLMRDERRKEERSKQGQTNNKAKQHSTPKVVTWVTRTHNTSTHSRQSALPLSYQGSSAGWAQITHLIVYT